MFLFGIICIVGFVNIYLMVPTFIVVVLFNKIRDFNLPTSRGIKRLEGISEYIILRIVNNQYYLKI